MLWRKPPRLSAVFASNHRLRGSAAAESVQLVAIQVAEISSVETFEALARRPLVLAAQCQHLLVDGVDLGARVDVQRHHRAVADRGGLAVEVPRHADTK